MSEEFGPPYTRESPRVHLTTGVRMEFERFGGFVEEYSANLSLGGMFVRSAEPAPIGARLRIEFRLGDDTPLIEGEGEVMWVRLREEGEGRPAGMGIRFLEIAAASRQLIFNVVDHHIEAGGIPFDLERERPDESREQPDGASERPNSSTEQTEKGEEA